MTEPNNGSHAFAMLGGVVRDVAGGANLALAMLPKAMAYAAVAGVPPGYGLYASCIAPALAVAFGSNRRTCRGLRSPRSSSWRSAICWTRGGS